MISRSLLCNIRERLSPVHNRLCPSQNYWDMHPNDQNQSEHFTTSENSWGYATFLYLSVAILQHCRLTLTNCLSMHLYTLKTWNHIYLRLESSMIAQSCVPYLDLVQKERCIVTHLSTDLYWCLLAILRGLLQSQLCCLWRTTIFLWKEMRTKSFARCASITLAAPKYM